MMAYKGRLPIELLLLDIDKPMHKLIHLFEAILIHQNPNQIHDKYQSKHSTITI